MDVKDESGGRRDAQSTLAAVTATSEARIRTLNNKVHLWQARPCRPRRRRGKNEALRVAGRPRLGSLDGRVMVRCRGVLQG